MNNNFSPKISAHFVTALLSLTVLAGVLLADPGPLSVWFATPGVPGNTTSWQQEALPVGNGKLAAMVYGGVASEQIQFNEDTVWGGQPHDYANPATTTNNLAALRTSCFNRAANGTMLANETSYLIGTPIHQVAYEPAGSLVFTFPHTGVSNYLRMLDLTNATVNVRYTHNGVTYQRDVFASAPSNRVIAVRLSASQAGKIAFTCSFSTLQTASYATNGNDLVMHASVTGFSDASGYGLANQVQYDARLRVIATGGTVTRTSSSVTVTNADEAVLLLGVASNVKNYNDLTADYVTICSNDVANAAALGYGTLRQAQTNDYQSLFNRVTLDLGVTARTNQPMGYRKKQIALDSQDPQLVTLDFQLGRYLIIAGSRPGSQPLNLQGKWNDIVAPDWGSKMTLNINEEMNYWGAEVCNLSECVLPLVDMVQDLSVTGNKVARSNYFSNGWVAHHNTDLWRAAAPCNGLDGVWPTGGAWLCQHVWWHYLYVGDTNWLATIGYPLMKGAAEFFQGYLVPHPTYTNWLVTCPSYSPEHDIGTYNVAAVPSPTMDNELVRDLFRNVISASQVLGVDTSFRTNIASLLSQLPPDQVGVGGQLQEWLEDVDATYDSAHRHCSHLVGFFPGDQISTFYTPTTAAAAKRSIDLRGYANNLMTPWAGAWRLNLRTRLLDGDGAWSNLIFLYSYSKVSTNLIFADNHRQLDCTFGRLSGIAEMFVQSQNGDLILLPALPTALTNGSVSGLCARGGFEVRDLTWMNGQFTGATIISKAGNTCNLRSRWPVVVKLGNSVVNAPMVLPGLYQFTTVVGSNYTVTPALVAEAENLAATTSGPAQQVVTNGAFGNWRAAQFNATAAGDAVSYTVSNLAAGTYRLVVTANASTNAGQFQLAAGSVGGALANVGAVQDTYSPTNVTYLLPVKLGTTTNVISLWTNLQREFDCGSWTAPSNGHYTFQFTVAGKHAASGGYTLTVDALKFLPPSVPPVFLRAELNPPGALTLTLTGQPGQTYLMQTTSSLTSAWQNLATNLADSNGLWSVAGVLATNDQRFFRALSL
jgi:alpha-L-fucosidase 2